MNIKCIYLRDKLKKYIKNSINCCISRKKTSVKIRMDQLLVGLTWVDRKIKSYNISYC